MKKYHHFNYFLTFFLGILIVLALPQCGQQDQKPAEARARDDARTVAEIEFSKEVKEVLERKKNLLLKIL